MQSPASLLRTLFLAAALAPGAAWAADAATGRMKGGIAYALPQWFKPSLLDLREDVKEAARQGKHVMVFLHLDECPYCARMLQESFAGETGALIQRHFDVVAVNIRGAQEAVWVDGTRSTEQALARRLRVFATPTLAFLGADGKAVLQLTGYRDPGALRHALDFVHSRSYREQAFADYLAARTQAAVVYTLRGHPQFAPPASLKGYRKPLAVLFEDRGCAECARFHDRTLRHPDVVAEMKKLLFVRLDADSVERIVLPDGSTSTPAQWVRALGITYRPGVVLFDEAREVFRIDARLYHFHFKETLRYVSEAHYKRFASISRYNAARREELLRQGIDIDYAE